VHQYVDRRKNNRMGHGDRRLRSSRGQAEEDTRSQNIEQDGGREKIPVHL